MWLMAAMIAVSTLSCSNGGSSEPPGQDQGNLADPSSSADASAVPIERDSRPFAAPARDQPGGPAHAETVPAEPTADDLARAAGGQGDRLGAEVFALTLSHALEDQTEEQGNELFERYLSTDLPQPARETIAQARRFPGNRYMPGVSAWLRSQDAPDGRVVVQLVELVESPTLGDGEGEPFVFWSENLLTVAPGSDGWELVDFQQQLMSEMRDFSPNIWKNRMDSGRGWRQVKIG
ncbi:hypothetical protein [Nocardioides ochotonae]|uniref:hypothetical protein n=1 Tax=Nocardioides ochotonae TaxID=2685869 RepID=UPI00140CF0F8|nr:hypothetical protein [Nocardioides ochotonae]